MPINNKLRRTHNIYTCSYIDIIYHHNKEYLVVCRNVKTSNKNACDKHICKCVIPIECYDIPNICEKCLLCLE